MLRKVELYSRVPLDTKPSFQGQRQLQNLRRSSNFSSIIHQYHPSLEGWANFRMIQSTTCKDDYADARFGSFSKARTYKIMPTLSTQTWILPATGYFSLETHLHSDPPLLMCSRRKEREKRRIMTSLFYSMAIPCSTSITKKQINWTDKIHFPSEQNCQRFLATEPGYYK